LRHGLTSAHVFEQSECQRDRTEQAPLKHVFQAAARRWRRTEGRHRSMDRMHGRRRIGGPLPPWAQMMRRGHAARPARAREAWPVPWHTDWIAIGWPRAPRKRNDMPSDGDAPRFGPLPREECRSLLARNRVGRIAFARGNRVEIIPIHYVFANGVVCGRTAPGTRLDNA